MNRIAGNAIRDWTPRQEIPGISGSIEKVQCPSRLFLLPVLVFLATGQDLQVARLLRQTALGLCNEARGKFL